MSKRKPDRTVAPTLEQATDYGPAFTRGRDARPVPAWDGATDGIELADIPDIARPDTTHTVRVARRADPLVALLQPRKDGPGRPQYVAAERFRMDTALADGVGGQSDGVAVQGGGGGVGPTGTMLDAQGRVRDAWLAIRGPANDGDIADVVRAVVLAWATLDTYRAAGRRVRRGTVREALDTGLNRLVDHYERVDSEKRD